MSVDDDKSLLDEYLADDPNSSAGQSELTRSYRKLTKPEPAGHLDLAILAEAREALRADQASPAEPFWSNWLKPLTVVTAMGVCLVLVLQVMQSNQQSLEQASREQASKPDSDHAERGAVDELAASREDRAVLQSPEPARAASKLAEPPPQLRSQREESLLSMEKLEGFADADDNARPGAEFAAVVESDPLLADTDSPHTSSDAVVVTARTAAESLQEVPAGIAAAAADSIAPAQPAASASIVLEEEADVQRARDLSRAAAIGAASVAEKKLAAGAAANEVIYPESDVWQAGIEAVQLKGEIELARLEQHKLYAVYPDQVPADSFAGRTLGLSDDRVSEQQVIDPPAASVWLAGIDFLLARGEQERAEEELARFRLVFPDHPAAMGGNRDR